MENQQIIDAMNGLQVRVETLNAINLDLWREPREHKVKKRLLWGPIFNLLFSGFSLVFIGSFFSNNWSALQGNLVAALPGMFLFGCAIFLINMSIRSLILSQELDYSKPVVDTQITLAKLRRLRIAETKWAFLLGIPTWFLAPIFLLQVLTHMKVTFPINAWMITNVVFGIALSGLIVWLMKSSRYAKAIQGAFAGHDVAEAESFLQELGEFKGRA